MRRLIAVVVLGIMLNGWAIAQTVAPNLTGTWVLNEKDSDLFKAEAGRAQDGPPPGGQGGGGRGGGGGGKGRDGGHGGQGGQTPADPEAQSRREEMKKQVSRLVIFQDGIELNVTNGLDISRLFFADGRTMDIWTQQGMAKATAEWTGPILVVQWQIGEEGPHQVRRYSLDESGNRLIVSETRQQPNNDKTVDLTLVYERSD